MKRRIVALCLVLILLLGAVPAAALETIAPRSPFTVTFLSNGGDPIDPSFATRIIQGGDPIGAVNMPPAQAVLRSGFLLSHWNTDPAGGTATVVTGDTIVSQNMTVYAIWGHPVEFLGNGVNLHMGTPGDPNDPTDYSPRSVLENMSVNEIDGIVWPDNPERPGFTFSGWWNMPINYLEHPTLNTQPVGAIEFDADTPITAGVGLHARWIMNPIHTLTFDPVQGMLPSGQTDTRSAVEGINIANSHNDPFWFNRLPDPTIPQANGTPIDRAQTSPAAEHPAATLHSWRFEPYGGGLQLAAVWVTLATPPLELYLTGDLTAYANWVYRVTFNPNSGNWPNPVNPANPTLVQHRDIQTALLDGTPTGGGIVADDAVTWVGWPHPPNHIAAAEPPTDPVRVGYIFYGWWTEQVNPHIYPDPTDPGDAAPGVQFFPDASWVDESTTVWARWIPNPNVSVRLFLNGADAQWAGLTPYQQNTAHGQSLTVNSPYQWRELPAGSDIRNSGGTSIGPGATSGAAPGSVVNHPIGGMPNIPTRPGYVFMGWYTEPMGGVRFHGGTTVDADIDVHARWLPAITINLNMHGGTQANGNPIQAQNLVRVVPLGYSLGEVSQIWRDARGVAGAGAAAILPLYYRTDCAGLREGLGNLYAYNAPHQGGGLAGVFSTEPDGFGDRFGMDTVIDQAWLDEHGITSNSATVHAVWAPIVTFNRNHNTFVPGTANTTTQR